MSIEILSFDLQEDTLRILEANSPKKLVYDKVRYLWKGFLKFQKLLDKQVSCKPSSYSPKTFNHRVDAGHYRRTNVLKIKFSLTTFTIEFLEDPRSVFPDLSNYEDGNFSKSSEFKKLLHGWGSSCFGTNYGHKFNPSIYHNWGIISRSDPEIDQNTDILMKWKSLDDDPKLLLETDVIFKYECSDGYISKEKWEEICEKYGAKL